MKSALDDALNRQGITASEEASIYLSELLLDFSMSNKAFGAGPGFKDGSLDAIFEQDASLTSIFSKASVLPIEKRIKTFMYLGDYTMFASGFFPAYFERGCGNIKYVQDIGAGSYWQLSQIFEGGVYQELAVNFRMLSGALNIVSINLSGASDTEALGLYSRYLQTKSPHLRDRLKKLGFTMPDENEPEIRK